MEVDLAILGGMILSLLALSLRPCGWIKPEREPAALPRRGKDRVRAGRKEAISGRWIFGAKMEKTHEEGGRGQELDGEGRTGGQAGSTR